MADPISALARVRRTHGIDLLPDETILQLLRSLGVVWRERLLTPLTTLRLFVLQILFGNTSKGHICCGTKTNVVTAIEIHGRDAGDAPILPSLVESTAKNFDVKEVSADKGYSGQPAHEAIAKIGATPYIAFKANTTGGIGGLFEKMFHYFQFNREDFLAHYHRRSNVESTVMMIKSKFGDSVRSKTDVAAKNEVLCKVLCHNICCLISAIYELGIDPVFKMGGCTNTSTSAHLPAQN